MKKKSNILIGTHNKGKFRELSYLLPKKLNKISPDMFDIKSPKETGKTFLDNSKLKAEYFFKKTKLTSLSDDSGLSVNCLNGKPGINSARYAIKCGGFRKAMKKISAVELMPKLEKFNAFHKQQGTDKKFIPLPETWLRGERWNDEIVVENLQPQEMTKELFNRRFGSAILLDHCKRNKPMLYAEALQKGWITNDSETS